MDLQKLIAHKMRPASVLVLSLALLLHPAISVSGQVVPPPVLTLDAGNGLTAEFSNYSLTDYAPVNGVYRGTFCFTLTNTSQTTSPRLPNFIVGAGLNSPTVEAGSFSLVSGSFPETFVSTSPIEINQIDYSVMLLAQNFFDAFVRLGVLGNALLDGPTDGVAQGASAEFCLVVSSSAPFDLQALIEKFTVVFSADYLACYETPPTLTGELPSYAIVHIESLADNELGFRIGNQTRGSVTPDPLIVTGVGFSIPGKRNHFSLIGVDPSPQPGNQNLVFTTSPGRLKRDPSGRTFDFGFITGKNLLSDAVEFGIPVGGTSSSFRISGNFTGLNTSDVFNDATVRFEGQWAPIANRCLASDPSGGGVRGTVATIPR